MKIDTIKILYKVIILLILLLFVLGSIAVANTIFLEIKGYSEMENLCENKGGGYSYKDGEDRCYLIENNTLVEYKILKFKDNWRLVK